jgi:hypothetical protein
MMNRFVRLLLAIVLLMNFNSYSYAAKGAASVYKITITKVELCETGSTISNCLNPDDITVGGGVADVDIAAVTAGEAAGVVADFSRLTPGKTYTYLQAILKREMKISGVADGCYTENDGVYNANDGRAVGSTSSSDQAEVSLFVPYFSQNDNFLMLEGSSDASGTSLAAAGAVRETDTHFRSRQVLSSSYTHKVGISPTVFLAFDTSLGVEDDVIYSGGSPGTCGSDETLGAAPPTQTITIQGQ